MLGESRCRTTEDAGFRDQSQVEKWKTGAKTKRSPHFPLLQEQLHSGGRTTRGNTSYFSHFELGGAACPKACIEKLPSCVQLPNDLSQRFSTFTVFSYHLGNS